MCPGLLWQSLSAATCQSSLKAQYSVVLGYRGREMISRPGTWQQPTRTGGARAIVDNACKCGIILNVNDDVKLVFATYLVE